MKATNRFLTVVAVTVIAAINLWQAQGAVITITPTGYASHNAQHGSPVRLIDNSSLNEPKDETATHNNTHEWHTGSGVIPWIVFDLGANYDLTDAYIWNFNWATDPARAVKDYTLYVSEGPAAPFTQVGGTRTLTQDTPPSLPNQQALVSDGVRRVMMQVISNYGSSYTGLWEVKFKGSLSAKQNPYNTIITPEAVTGTAADLGSLAALINGAGYPGTTFQNINEFHDTNLNNMWRASGNSGQTLTFDLGSTVHEVGGTAVWNYNRGGFTATGVKDFDVYISTTGPSGDFTYLTRLTLDQSTGRGEASYLNFPAVTLANAIRFDIVSNWGDGTHTGLSEVRFFTGKVPPPSGTVIMMR